jgi:hypothetical protein
MGCSSLTCSLETPCGFSARETERTWPADRPLGGREFASGQERLGRQERVLTIPSVCVASSNLNVLSYTLTG